MALDLISARCSPLEGAMEEEDGEVELTLGLSVGGNSRKAPRAGAATQGRVAVEARSGKAELNLGGSGSSPSSSSPRPPPLPPFLRLDSEGAAARDQARRREIHALRRQEARRKRDEKKQQQQQRRGICRGLIGAAPAAAVAGFCSVLPPMETTCSSDERLAMEARENRVRAKGREARLEEALDSVPNHKLSANHDPNHDADANPNLSLDPNYSNPNLVPFAAQSLPVVAMPYSYPHLQYMPTTNGFGIPCMMPCWAPGMSPAAERPRSERNVFQPMACRAFQPYSPPVVEPTNRESPQSSNAVEPNHGKGAGVESPPSWTASQGSSSSPAASAHQSGSLKGGSRSSSSSSTSDGRSRSRQTRRKFQPQPQPGQPPLHQAASLPRRQSDNSISSRPIEPDLNAVEEAPLEKRPTPCPNGSPSANEPVSAAQAPRLQLPRMPCVSATGDGPNGRTITGVLYRYTKAEVSIVCACHGSSFSPAEFVQHAGGTDVTHPLRQITVVSS